MKKFFIALSSTLLALLCFATPVSAQQWKSEYVEGDELKGTEGYYTNYYIDEENNIVAVTLSVHKSLGVSTRRGIFDYDSDSEVQALVGYYLDGKLESKEKAVFRVSSSSPSNAFCFNSAIVDRIAKHLAKGEVRLVIPRYGRTDFDIKLSKNTALK